MTDFRKKLVVKAGPKLKLNRLPTDWHGKHRDDKSSAPELEKHLMQLDHLQYAMYAEGKHSLLIVLQGLDAAGKDGVIRHVLTGMNPQGCTVTGFKQPTPEEASHDFLWRVHPHAPRKGAVAIFNRSYYEDVLITRVHKAISRKECLRRDELINEFERTLTEENGTTILKFFLHISKKEQLARFRQRLDDPARHWKISEGDYREREFWSKYTKAYQDLLRRTSTKHAPWYIVPSDHKWFRNLAISQIITASLEELRMRMPSPTVDLKEIRKKYHAAAKES